MKKYATNAISLGIGLGAAAVGVVAGIAIERVAMGKKLFGKDEEREVPLGSLRGTPRKVMANDGTMLYVEIDEPQENRDENLTIIFCHGYALNQDSWHFQREFLRDKYRLVFWDQRGHGRSERGPKGSATIEQIGHDLAAVIDQVCGEGPLILVGHSMGGMTVMSFAANHPEVFTRRVIGAGLIATSAGGLANNDLGFITGGHVFHKVAPNALALLAKMPKIVERGHRLGADLEEIIIKHYSFRGPTPPDVVQFTTAMIVNTQIEVISDFYSTIETHDKEEALAALAGIETLVLVGDHDLLTPIRYSDAIVRRLPHAERVVVKDGGHMIMLEHPELVTPHIVALIDRARRSMSEQSR